MARLMENHKDKGTVEVNWCLLGETNVGIRCGWVDSGEGTGLRTPGGQVEHGNQITTIALSENKIYSISIVCMKLGQRCTNGSQNSPRFSVGYFYNVHIVIWQTHSSQVTCRLGRG